MPKMTYKILMRRQIDDQSEIVLCAIEGATLTPYVTWMHRLTDHSMHWGHYFATLPAACRDYDNRISH